jgi:ADP-ribose pyrophosphatase YjhB (NUDIX family)
MLQKYKVFTENKTLLFESYEQPEKDNFIDLSDGFDSEKLLNKINKLEEKTIRIPMQSVEDFLRFKSNFRLIQAGGGVVFNENKVLMIFRNDKWDFPKGWIEPNEYPMQAALREVREECGELMLQISDVTPLVTAHLYKLKGKVVWKETFWYAMKAEDHYKLKPQRKEGIQIAEFVPQEEVGFRLENSYPLLVDLWEIISQNLPSNRNLK